MRIQRRTFLGASAAAGLAQSVQVGQAQSPGVPEAIRRLRPMTDGIQPITDDERRARIEKARKLMVENKIDAIVFEGGTSMYYFTGTRWGGSERTFALVLPARGEPAWVVPGFEEMRAREVDGPTECRDHRRQRREIQRANFPLPRCWPESETNVLQAAHA